MEKEGDKALNTAIVGRNAVRELLKSGRDIDKIFVAKGDREGSISVIVAEAIKRKIPVIETDRNKLDSISGGIHHQGIAAMAAEHDYASVSDILENAEKKGQKPFIIIADGIEDPYNLGAIIRSAEAAGVHGIIIPKRHSVGLTAAVAKASAGAIEYVPVAKTANLAQTIEELKKHGIWIYAVETGGMSYTKCDYTSATAFILGSEGEGVSRLLKERSDFIVSIPMSGNVNSLNVSNAAAVVMYETVRQRNMNVTM